MATDSPCEATGVRQRCDGWASHQSGSEQGAGSIASKTSLSGLYHTSVKVDVLWGSAQRTLVREQDFVLVVFQRTGT